MILPSGLPAGELGLAIRSELVLLPAGLVVPDAEDGRRLLASLPGSPLAPAWWKGWVRRRDASLVVSTGSVSLNSQAVPLLEAAESAGARSLVVLAPLVTDEALATLLVNDLQGVFREGVLPLRLHVPEPHVGEVLEAIAAALGVPPWDGRRGTARLVRIPSLEATLDGARVWLRPPSPLRRAAAWVTGH